MDLEPVKFAIEYRDFNGMKNTIKCTTYDEHITEFDDSKYIISYSYKRLKSFKISTVPNINCGFMILGLRNNLLKEFDVDTQIKSIISDNILVNGMMSSTEGELYLIC